LFPDRSGPEADKTGASEEEVRNAGGFFWTDLLEDIFTSG